MSMRVFLDTSVLLRVAYNEGAPSELAAFVGGNRPAEGEERPTCHVTAPVLLELWHRIDREVEHFRSYQRDLANLIKRIRSDTSADGEHRPEKLEVKTVIELAERLQAESTMMGSLGDARRRAIVEIVTRLAESARESEFHPRTLARAFDLERDLEARMIEVPNRQDVLVLCSVLEEAAKSDVFLTYDGKQRKAAQWAGLDSPHPKEFAVRVLAKVAPAAKSTPS